jgi:hypothetical protein
MYILEKKIVELHQIYVKESSSKCEPVSSGVGASGVAAPEC